MSVYIQGTMGMVTLGKHRTDEILAFIVKSCYWREAFEAWVLQVVWLMKQPWRNLNWSSTEAVPFGERIERREFHEGLGGQKRAYSSQHQGWFSQKSCLPWGCCWAAGFGGAAHPEPRARGSGPRGDEGAVGRMGSAAHREPAWRIQNLVRAKLTCSQRRGKQHVGGCAERSEVWEGCRRQGGIRAWGIAPWDCLWVRLKTSTNTLHHRGPLFFFFF